MDDGNSNVGEAGEAAEGEGTAEPSRVVEQSEVRLKPKPCPKEQPLPEVEVPKARAKAKAKAKAKPKARPKATPKVKETNIADEFLRRDAIESYLAHLKQGRAGRFDGLGFLEQ